MLEVDKPVFLQISDESDKRVLHPGKIVGVAILDHPQNHGHPCRWHARDYGLFAANPWGIWHFEGGPKGAGDTKLEKGRSVTLRYRLYFHAGNTDQAAVARQYEKFASMPAPASGKRRN